MENQKDISFNLNFIKNKKQIFFNSKVENTNIYESFHNSKFNDSFSNSNSKKLSEAFGVNNSILMTPSYKEENLDETENDDYKLDDKTLSLILSDNEEKDYKYDVNEISDTDKKYIEYNKKNSLKLKLKNKIITPFNPCEYSSKKNLNKTLNYEDKNIKEANSTQDSFGNLSTKSKDGYQKIEFIRKYSLNSKFLLNTEVKEVKQEDNQFKNMTMKMNKYKKYNKKAFQKYINEDEYNINLENIENNKKTTLMIKNIPNKYTKEMMLEKINEKFEDKYDFFYLPIDFENKCNVGYAFINFTKNIDIKEFYLEFNNKKWKKFKSDKICSIKYARIQGPNEYKYHFKNSGIMKKDDQNLKPFIQNNIKIKQKK